MPAIKMAGVVTEVAHTSNMMKESKGIRLGFSTLSVFMRPPESWADTAIRDNFNAMEILCEGPMWPRSGLWKEKLPGAGNNGLDVYLHAPP